MTSPKATQRPLVLREQLVLAYLQDRPHGAMMMRVLNYLRHEHDGKTSRHQVRHALRVLRLRGLVHLDDGVYRFAVPGTQCP